MFTIYDFGFLVQNHKFNGLRTVRFSYSLTHQLRVTRLVLDPSVYFNLQLVGRRENNFLADRPYNQPISIKHEHPTFPLTGFRVRL